MYILNFNEPCKLHFTGIGGISMSGIAEILLNWGFTVSGSNNVDSELLHDLSKAGIKTFHCYRF